MSCKFSCELMSCLKATENLVDKELHVIVGEGLLSNDICEVSSHEVGHQVDFLEGLVGRGGCEHIEKTYNLWMEHTEGERRGGHEKRAGERRGRRDNTYVHTLRLGFHVHSHVSCVGGTSILGRCVWRAQRSGTGELASSALLSHRSPCHRPH